MSAQYESSHFSPSPAEDAGPNDELGAELDDELDDDEDLEGDDEDEDFDEEFEEKLIDLDDEYDDIGKDDDVPPKKGYDG